MTLRRAQKTVDYFMGQFAEGYFPPHEIMTLLTEEIGDMARGVSHLHGPKYKKPDESRKELSDEIGDVLYSLICMANAHGIDAQDAIRRTILKINTRDLSRWKKKENYSLRHWKPEHFFALEDARTYYDLGKIALDVLQKMPRPIGQVCGPISSGGHGSIEKNMEYFNRTIEKLNERGIVVFNQMPFEIPMQEMKISSQLPKEEANLKLLQDFYFPIFESGLIDRLYFMNDWKTSHGARIERQRAIDRRISIQTLPQDFLDSMA